MQFDSDLIASQIILKYPNVFCHVSQNFMIGRPIFPDTAKKNKEHIVVVGRDTGLQFVAKKDCRLIAYVGFEEEEIQSVSCDYLVFPPRYAVTEVFNGLNEIFDRLVKFRQAMEDSVNMYYSYNNILNSCELLFDVPVSLIDSQFRYISFTKRLAYLAGYDKYVQNNSYLPLEDINYLNSLQDYKKLEKESGVFHYVAVENLLHRNIFHKGQYIARLSIPYSESEILNRGYSCLLNILAYYIEMLYDRFGTFRRVEKRDTMLKQYMMDLLEHKTVDAAVLWTILNEKEYMKNDDYYVIRFTSGFTNNNEDTANALANRLEMQNPGVTCIQFRGKTIALVNNSHYERKKKDSFMQQLAYYLRDSLLQAGVSRKFKGLMSLEAAYRQSEIALEYGNKKDYSLWCFRFDDYALTYLIQNGMRGFAPEQVCHTGILKLMAYDQDHNTELNKTLRTYIEQQYNASDTARVLYVGRSSFLKRMERIEKLTGITLEDYSTRLYLALSYAMFG